MALADIAELIRNGSEVKVLDAKTGENVTAYILTQIVMEQAKNKNTLLPASLLHLIIQYGDTELTDFFKNHLKRIILNYMELKQAADHQFSEWLKLGKSFTESARQGFQSMSPFHDISKEKQEKAD
jgi:polyhydroxyalkanoate synthesis repressor PhaR